MDLEKNFFEVNKNINNICKRIGRDSEEIKVVAISKTFPASSIIELNKIGQNDFGESKVKELIDKYYSPLFENERQVKWHMVGHLQSNKVKSVIEFISLIQSVDSFKLAKEIDFHSKKISKIIDILIQVNTSNESQKYGIIPLEAENLCKQISVLENVRIKGLMTMAKLTDDKNIVRSSFKTLRELFDNLKQQFKDFEFLSMGMSNDYDVAIEEGSNMLRIGSAIFGVRDKL